MSIRLWARAAAPAAIAAATALAAATPAQAAGQPSWTSSASVGVPGDRIVISSVTATSAANAWAVGVETPVSGPGKLLIEQWANGVWTRATLPGTVPALSTASSIPVTAVGASSPSNVWAFALNARGNPAAFHWDGATWMTMSLPSWFTSGPGVVFNQLRTSVFSKSDIWVYGIGASFAAHFNGRRWMKVKFGTDALAVSAVSPKNIWVVGGPSVLAAPVNARPRSGAALAAAGAARQRDVLRHWNGRTWRTIAMPSPFLSRRRVFQVAASAAVGTRSLYVDGAVSPRKHPSRLQDSQLLRWNGRRWSRVTVPVKGGALSAVVDRRGGLWMAMLQPQAGFTTTLAYYHRGRWAVGPAPSQGAPIAVAGLAVIPGGVSVWGVGSTSFVSSASDGMIVKHGK